MGLRDWLCYELGTDFPVPGKVYDYDSRFQKWVNGITHQKYLAYRSTWSTYTTCMDFLMGVHNRIQTITGLSGQAYFQPGLMNSIYPPAWHTFNAATGDIPQSGDFYLCLIPGGYHVGVFLEVSQNNLRIICGGADDAQTGEMRGAISMKYGWPDNLVGWLNIAEFYQSE